MSPYEIYEKRIGDFSARAEELNKRCRRLGVARLLLFIGALAVLTSFSYISVVIAISGFVILMVIFTLTVIWNISSDKRRDYYTCLTDINRLELKSLDGDISGFQPGTQYSDRDHPYSFDLDLFGRASLFQYLNRTTTLPASDMLAGYLRQAAPPDQIKLRQEAAAELGKMIDWRQDMMTFARNVGVSGSDPARLLEWLKSGDHFSGRPHLRLIALALSTIGIATVVSVIAGLPPALLAPVLAINLLFNSLINKDISLLHGRVSRYSELLKTYSSITGAIENTGFSSILLAGLRSRFMLQNKASVAVKELSSLVSKLDRRMNVLVSIPANILFFKDLFHCYSLEKWKRKYAPAIPGWFEAMAEFEALCSLGNCVFNNPDWPFPEVTDDYFTLKAYGLGHPLIPAPRRICNDIEITGSGRTILITGSNMSGKSTFLRTCGVNAILALCGAPVCASSFTISHVNILTSMRISDSLEDNISSFYAELKRLHSIIGRSEHNRKMFILLDEILRGTNSNDRFTGSVALIKQLSGYGTVAMVATHDLKLAELSDGLPVPIENYHFDVKIRDEELYFDYILTPGICKSLNATVLMKKMGIRL